MREVEEFFNGIEIKTDLHLNSFVLRNGFVESLQTKQKGIEILQNQLEFGENTGEVVEVPLMISR